MDPADVTALPDIRVKPVPETFLIRQDEPPEQTEAGIIYDSGTSQAMTPHTGVVVMVGDGVPDFIKIGTRVGWSREAMPHASVEIDGIAYWQGHVSYIVYTVPEETT